MYSLQSFLFIQIVLLILFSCSNTDQKNAATATDSSKTELADTTATVQLKDAKLQSIYDGYISLKNSLVDTKYDESKNAASELQTHLAAYKGCEQTATVAGKIAGAKDIVEQRKQFTQLSADLIAVLKQAELSSGAIYVQHCPMANNGDGGDWLSSQKNIQNPYYGDEMMECGAVLAEIK
ncbi:MAG: DUF3347 domain-containing protein [Pedobacter sp.]|nr:MAG: DUF3347 domain-containing protein [Pedobacter sp.]